MSPFSGKEQKETGLDESLHPKPGTFAVLVSLAHYHFLPFLQDLLLYMNKAHICSHYKAMTPLCQEVQKSSSVSTPEISSSFKDICPG